MDPFEIYDTSMRAAVGWAAAPGQWLQSCHSMMAEVQQALTEESKRFASSQNSNRRREDSFEERWRAGMTQLARGSQKLHGLVSEWLIRMAEQAPDLTEAQRRRALFWTRQLTGAWQPANCFWLNSLAVRRMLDSKGESIFQGLESLADDFKQRDGLSRLVDENAFEIGRNLVCTPGSVVFRNRLMELIQYAPATPAVYVKPVVLVQPWINKYYIFDLQPTNSFVRFLVSQGFTVFITSWKNPTADMAEVRFEDYMLEGAMAAIDVAREISGVDQVHAAGYCIGGTALAALMAWLNAGKGAPNAMPVADWTLFTTLIDFSEPGDLGVLIGDKSIAFIQDLMEREGYLEGKYISLAFRLLKADHLIWRAFAHTCLQGQVPPGSDVLYWNSDATNLPKAAGSFLLQTLYRDNRLVNRGPLELAGRTLDFQRIDQPLYLVGALQDHICPWPGTFATCRQVQSPARYVLANEGHIAGIVNPPSTRSKKKYWAGSVDGVVDPEKWLASQAEQRGSWWNDWAAWLARQGDEQVAPPTMGSTAHPPIEPAPGRYVRE